MDILKFLLKDTTLSREDDVQDIHNVSRLLSFITETPQPQTCFRCTCAVNNKGRWGANYSCRVQSAALDQWRVWCFPTVIISCFWSVSVSQRELRLFRGRGGEGVGKHIPKMFCSRAPSCIKVNADVSSHRLTFHWLGRYELTVQHVFPAPRQRHHSNGCGSRGYVRSGGELGLYGRIRQLGIWIWIP